MLLDVCIFANKKLAKKAEISTINMDRNLTNIMKFQLAIFAHFLVNTPVLLNEVKYSSGNYG